MMPDFNLPTDDLIEAYVLSNTPAQLFLFLEPILAEKNISKEYTIDALIEKFNQLNNPIPTSLSDLAMSYAIIVSAYFLPIEKARLLLEKLSLEHLEWGKVLKKWVYYYFPTEELTSFKILNKPSLDPPDKYVSEASGDYVNLSDVIPTKQ